MDFSDGRRNTIRSQPAGLSAQDVADRIAPYLREAYGNPTRHEGTALSSEQWLQTLAGAIRDELDCMSDAAKASRFAFADEIIREPDALESLSQGAVPEVLRAFADGWARLPAYDYDTADAFFGTLRRQFKETRGLSGKQVMQPIRAALTGSLRGPCLVVVSILLGKDRCLERITAALKS
jgi:glutamyl/glutaminyl-tRNA synthetase